MHLHLLKGCAPTPLANYLKALGILRLVAEQVDSDARGSWDGEVFCLLSRLTRGELEEFFLERYQTTPIFNPWGGRSGFYPGSSEKTARVALESIESSNLPRLEQFRHGIRTIRDVVATIGGLKPDCKERLVIPIRLRLRGPGLDWLDTVVANLGDSFRGPALFGSGGNEGSGSYTAAFFAAVVEVILERSWDHALSSCLWAVNTEKAAWDGRFTSRVGSKLKKENVAAPFRQFLPSGRLSPWDLLLCFEGSLVVQSGVSRRSLGGSPFLASPFYFEPLGIGAGSSSRQDEYVLNKGQESPGRGEQWFPLWSHPGTFTEVRALFSEGRCSLGRQPARNPIQAARALGGLGGARGINSYIRYGYLQRDNLATHFAVPLGRVQIRGSGTVRLVDDILPWLDRLHTAARRKRPQSAPARLVQAEHRLADSVFAALTHDHSAVRWQSILLAAVNIESLQATGTAIQAGPIPPLRPEWVEAVADGSPEVRLALALGSAAGYFRAGRPHDSVRFHWLPLQPGGRQFKISDQRLSNDPRVVARGRDPLRDLVALIERRLTESVMEGQRRSRMVAAPGCGARLDDLAAVILHSPS